MSGARVPMECVGGPLDGHQTVAPRREEPLAVHLFRTRGPDGQKDVWAYAQMDRTTRTGHMVLNFLLKVGETSSPSSSSSLKTEN